MLDAQQQHAIRNAFWRTFDTVRGSAEVGAFRDHLLALLVLKYLSDRDAGSAEHDTALNGKTGKPPLFEGLSDAGHMADLGKRIDHALANLEDRHPLLQGAFHDVSFDSSALGNPEQRQRVLSDLLGLFGGPEFDYRDPGAAKSVAFACETLISEIAAASGKRGAEFYTPPEVSQLIAGLLQPEAGESVGDPCCGSGTLLLTCSAAARARSGGEGCHLFGQEKNGSTWALAKINMLVHGELSAQLEWGDTLKSPRLVVGDQLRKFDLVVSSPPFNLKDWGQEAAASDPYGRYRRGIPPRGTADYAFISHMVETLKPDHGRMAVVVTHGVLFRSGAEQQIRRQLLEENLVDAVIGLPAKLFPNTALPVALLVLRKDKRDNYVLFIDASREHEHGKTQNKLREMDVSKIEDAYVARGNADGYASLVSLEAILANDCNLNVARYVDAIEEFHPVDLIALREERAQLRAELEALESKFTNLLQEVGHA
ncbi:N-6 DNA methylase [Variovorax sp. ZT4R33]|uniref:N-6 DNA methylase n=1 Tax=Variovorax sp. ZT4R33 TaxID=3443743 RepID=UPI003F48DA94